MFTVNLFSSLLCNFIFLTFHILAFCAEFVNIFLYDKNILQNGKSLLPKDSRDSFDFINRLRRMTPKCLVIFLRRFSCDRRMNRQT